MSANYCTSTTTSHWVKMKWPVFSNRSTSITYGHTAGWDTTVSNSNIEVLEQRRSPHLDKDSSYVLPDGSRLYIDANGNFRIDDRDAKVVYKANHIREFSPHLNASDLLGKFIEYVGSLGKVTKEEALALPIKLFISWLIIEAAERDGDPVPTDIVPVSRAILLPRCLKCGRFIAREHARLRFPFCSPQHAMLALEAA